MMDCPKIPVKVGVPLKMDEGDNSSFVEWMGKVDAYLSRFIGLVSADLPDCNWRDWYSSRLRPIRAANRALRLAYSGDAGGDVDSWR